MSVVPNATVIASEMAQAKTLVDSVNGTKYLAVACCGLLIYDYLLTFDQEIRLFWCPDLTYTRVLFFLNRYVPPAVFVLCLTGYFRPSPGPEFCFKQFVVIASFFALEIVIMQAILVVRVIHLWSTSPRIQRLVFGAFVLFVVVAGTIFTFIMRASSSTPLPAPLQGCFPEYTGSNGHLYWALWIPTFILESLLVALTVVRAVQPLKRNKDNKLIKCLVRDGCLFYFAVCVCIGFEMTGSALWRDPGINSPAVVSGFLQAFLSICASRLLFSLHELADELLAHPTFVLNNFEMSRLQMRKGQRRAEYFVEIDVPEIDFES